MRNFETFGICIHPEASKFGESFCCGVEHEVENIDIGSMGGHETASLKQYANFHIDDDFSLIDGKEIITTPNNLRAQISFHEKLHSLEVFTGERFSDRTSSHVHVNVSFLTSEQTLALLKMYCLLEPYFFSFVGEDREHNINCVPLWATSMIKNLFKKEYPDIPHTWHKYTALNLKPMTSIGTIEFRHLYGTQDNKTFANWVGLIKSLYDWAVDDGGRFNDVLPQLLGAGYTAVEEYLEKLACPLGKFISLLKPHSNAERCYDVYLLLTTEVYGGLSNWKKYVKDNV